MGIGILQWICIGYVSCPICLSWVWGHSEHFAKFPTLRFLKCYPCNSFHQSSTKIHTKYHNKGLIWAVTFLAISQELPKCWHLEIFLKTEQYGAGNFNTILLQQFFFRILSKPYEEIAYHREMQALNRLGNRPS